MFLAGKEASENAELSPYNKHCSKWLSATIFTVQRGSADQFEEVKAN
jgi:hypothetical protein